MADEPQYTSAQLSDGTILQFQGQLNPAQVRMKVAAYRAGPGKAQTNITDPQQMQQMAQGQAQQVTSPQTAGASMQTSIAPDVVRGAGAALPAVGSILGGMAGTTGAPGLGTAVGGGLGMAGGEAARQAVMGKIFGDEPSLAQVGIAGITGTAAEIPAAIAIGRGNYLLKTLAQAKSPQQVGDVLEAFKSVNPIAGTRTGLQAGLEMANRKLGNQLGGILKSATGTVDFGATVESQALAQAATEDAGFARQLASGKIVSDSRVTNGLKDAIQGAKSVAGIQGNIANAEQLWKFQNVINDRAFRKALIDKNPGVGTVVDKILQGTYRNSGGMLRSLAPDAAPLLEQMTDVHAGISALQNVGKFGGLGKGGAIAVSAALNPKLAVTMSPAVTAAAAASTEIPAVKKAGQWVTQ